MSESDRDRPRGAKRRLEINDPEEYSTGRRLRQVHDAKEKFPERVREEQDRLEDEEISEGRFREVISETLAWYLMEIEPVVESDELDGRGEDVVEAWRDEPIGDVELTLEEIVNGMGYTEEREPLSLVDATAAYRKANKIMHRARLGLQVDDGLPEDEL